MAKIADMVEKIGETFTKGYQKIENGVVGGYKKVENKFTETFLEEDGSLKTGKIGEGVVEGFGKVSDKFVETLFAKEGESVEDAKKRLSGEK